jgi:glucoamylase
MLVSLFATVVLAQCALAQTNALSTYISFESPVAQTKLLDNIGSNGAKAPGAFPGVVVARQAPISDLRARARAYG